MGRALSFAVGFLVLVMTAPALAADAPHMRFELITAFDEVAPGGDFTVGIKEIPDQGWHTYWINPGDAGLAPTVKWHLPTGASAGPLEWPAPHRIPYSGTVDYGFDHPATLVSRIHISRSFKAGAAITVAAHIKSLVCQQMCEPVSADLTHTVVVSSQMPTGEGRLQTALEAIPRSLTGFAKASPHGDFVDIALPPLAGISSLGGAYVFAEQDGLIDPNSSQVALSGKPGLTLRVKTAGKAWTQGEVPLVLTLPDGSAFRLIAKHAAASPARNLTLQLLVAMLLAFAGGLILNLMPCVLPILSMKALALAQAGHDARTLRRDGMFYFAGVIVSFALIGGALAALRMSGAAIGWGFQLQSPAFVLALILLVCFIGLNLLGAFALPMSLAGIGDHLVRGKDGRAAFFTGALAVLVASPCTAPFMGAALGLALAVPAFALPIFLALGIGFAAPFTALTLTPALRHLVPRPGPWMTRFKELLAFPMFATAIWLLWVLVRQTGATGLVFALVAGLAITFALWLAPQVTSRWRAMPVIASMLVLVGAMTHLHARPAQPTSSPQWSPWSEQAVADARRHGKAVLVDFGAAWCITCLVNEHMALDDPDVRANLRRAGVVTLKADWTSHDPAIASELQHYGRAGVPLYLLFPPDPTRPPLVLPQILTPKQVDQALSELKL